MKLVGKSLIKLSISLIITLLCFDCFTPYKNFKNQIKPVKGNLSSPIYSSDQAVDLLINISKKICSKPDSTTINNYDYDNIITGCLNNLKTITEPPSQTKLKNFWNMCIKYFQRKDDISKKSIDQILIEELHYYVRNEVVKGPIQHGSSCKEMLVVGKFNQDAVLVEIEEFLSKYNLDKTVQIKGLITSMIGVHRSMADSSMFNELNGNISG